MAAAILLFGIGSAFAALWASRSDGGAQILDDYYRQAVNWDEAVQQRAAAERNGWHVEVAVAAHGIQPALRQVTVALKDRQGKPLEGVTGTIRASRPQLAHAVAEIPLVPAPDQPGVFVQQMPVSAPGLWDFDVIARRDTIDFVTHSRIEIR